jgi:phenylpropionate dioxygenase-like ring-hydroxylating dioxygenase large terminal subunit
VARAITPISSICAAIIIFGTAWIYIGHESQVKKPGDYFATQIGRRPVVMVRDAEGGLRVIRNQCAHRGAMVVATEKGSADEFTCCYHGWTYHLDGRLKAVPLNHGYPRDFKVGDPNMSMQSVARVKSYRGFIFASDHANVASEHRASNSPTAAIHSAMCGPHSCLHASIAIVNCGIHTSGAANTRKN